MDINHRHNRNHHPSHAQLNRVLGLGLLVVLLAIAYFIFIAPPNLGWFK